MKDTAREAAIKIAQEAGSWFDRTDLTLDERESAVATLVEEYTAALADKETWVPVGERLPIRSGIYYVTLFDGTVGRSAYYIGAFDRPVLAWMPVPKPYTRDTTEDVDGYDIAKAALAKTQETTTDDD